MIKFLVILLILALVMFVVNQSQVIETVKVMDGRLGVAKDEYHLNLENLFKYFHGISKKIQKVSRDLRRD